MVNTENNVLRISRLYSAFLLVGIIVGFLIILFSQLPLEWLLYCYVGLILAIASLIIVDKEHYFQLLLIMTISVGRPFLVGTPFSRHLGGAQDVPDFFMSDIWLFILLSIWIGKIFNKNRSLKVNIQFMDIAFMMLILWSFFSVILAQNYPHGFFELIRMIKQFLLYFYISRNITSKDDVQYVISCLMAVLSVQSLIAIYQYGGGEMPFGFFNEVDVEEATTGARRVGGTLFSCIALSQFLELLIPIALVLVLSQRRKILQISYWIVFCIGTIALIFTFSRGAILTLGFSILIIVMIQLLPIFDRKNNKFLLSLRILFMVILILSIFIGFKDEVLLRFSDEAKSSALARIPMNIVALSMIKQSPVFGIGLNNFNEMMNFYGMSVLYHKTTDFVHNAYLYYASEIGLPGLFILFLILWNIYFKSFQILKRDKNLFRFITIGIMASITSYLMIHSNVSPGFKYLMPIGNLLWLLFGMVVAMEKIKIKQNGHQGN